MNTISTHVLDTTRGTPADGVAVRLDRQEGADQWREIGSGRTSSDGRCSQLVPSGQCLSQGTYRLVFDTASYHANQGMQSFYPIVHVVFVVREGDTRLHIPLLLNPYGYTTYRGS